MSAIARAEDRVVAYVPNWIDLAAFAETIDFSKITHLSIAFENPANDELILPRAKSGSSRPQRRGNRPEEGRAKTGAVERHT